MRRKDLITGMTGIDGACFADPLLEEDDQAHGIKPRESLFNTDDIDNFYNVSQDFELHRSIKIVCSQGPKRILAGLMIRPVQLFVFFFLSLSVTPCFAQKTAFASDPPSGIIAFFNQEASNIVAFQRPELGHHIALWKITDDPTVRDHANYHSVDCWSPDGRYVCYTHWGGEGSKAPGNSSAATIRLYDLNQHEDRLIGKGIDPRWANRNNWLFYTRYDHSLGKLCNMGTALMWMDVNSGKMRRLAYGVERQGETDNEDRWVYAKRRSCEMPWSYTTLRVPIKADAEVEILSAITGSQPMPNPQNPVLFIRQSNSDAPFSATRLWYDLDGRQEKIFVPMIQKSHMSWLGNGEYLMLGDGLIRGRLWSEPYPSNLNILSFGSVGDISACGKAGRFVCSNSVVADLRSGDAWVYMKPLSMIALPQDAGDNSNIYDPDPKGSPDGTKICFVSNYPISGGPASPLESAVKPTDTLIEVASTNGFAESGRLLVHAEVIEYKKKTVNRFLELTRGLYGTSIMQVKKGLYVKSFDAAILEKKHLDSLVPSETMSKVIQDQESPLMHQRQTDVYVAVIRQPDRPWLQSNGENLQLVPGESHFETVGYHIFRNGQRITQEPIQTGQTFQLENAGTYQAMAVEWSGLQSALSTSVLITKPSVLQVLDEKPADFSWTQVRWILNGKEVTTEEAAMAEHASKEVVHRYDGLIQREAYRGQDMTQREDLNFQGKTTRKWTYQNSKLTERLHFDRDGRRISMEYFDQAGFVTEFIYYKYPNEQKAIEYDHWFYEKGVPVKRIFKESETHVKQGEDWVLVKE